MKAYLDGNEVCITATRFTNLQESPALFYEQESLMGRKALSGELSYGEQMDLYELLGKQMGSLDCPNWGRRASGHYGSCLDCEVCEVLEQDALKTAKARGEEAG